MMNLELNIYWNNSEKHDRPTSFQRVWVPTEVPCGCRLIRYLILISYLVNSRYLCFTMQVAILCYPGAAFGWMTPPYFGCQPRTLSETNQQWRLWLYTKHLMDMLPRFWISWSSTFEKYSIFHPWQGFSANNFTSRNAILFIFFKTWKAIDSLTCVPNFLFSDIYLNLLFNFKGGSSLYLSCLMSSMIIIIALFVSIIKRTCFNNTILMAEPERQLP